MERPANFDPVQRPKHYNSHPSGVECIEIVEHMRFNLGNAVKYLWRGGLKISDPTQDFEKALWYVNREMAVVPAYVPTPRQIEHFTQALSDGRARRALAQPSPWCEPVRVAISALIDFHAAGEITESSRLLTRAERCIQTAISDCFNMGRGMEP